MKNTITLAIDLMYELVSLVYSGSDEDALYNISVVLLCVLLLIMIYIQSYKCASNNGKT
jgi:hypothetical protein